MQYSAIQAAVQKVFDDDATLLLEINDWITAREGEVWQYAPWPIKQSVQLNLTVTGGTATVALPTGMTWTSQGIVLRDNYGQELAYMDPPDFFDYFGSSPSQPLTNQTPTSWTLTTDPTASSALVFRLGPTPNLSTTFTVHGWNLPIKRSAASTWTIGTMSSATDLPWWPDPFHFFLVSGAAALGGRLKNFLDWQSLENDFQQGLQRLRKETMPLQRHELVQWGGDMFGPWGDAWL